MVERDRRQQRRLALPAREEDDELAFSRGGVGDALLERLEPEPDAVTERVEPYGGSS
jgi:hypothetical protein